MISVEIKAYDLSVRIEQSEGYPDALSDAVNRAMTAFTMAVATMKSAEIPVGGADQIPDDEE